MKNNYLNIVFILLLAITLSSCFSDVVIDIEEEKSLIVLNAWFTAGETPIVNVYQSKSIFEGGNFRRLGNARLMLLEDGEELGVLRQDSDGRYVNETIVIKANREYTLKATHDLYPSAVATVKVPELIDAERLNVNHSINEVVESGYAYQQSEINLSIQDEASSDDYYGITVSTDYVYYYDNGFDEDTIRDSHLGSSLESVDPQVDYMYIGYGQIIGIQDDFFNGETYQNTLKSYNDLRYYESSGDNYYSKESSTIIIYKFDKQLYQYFLTLENNQYPEPFTEPSQVYSNVIGGYGILGAASSLRIPIEEERTY